MEINQLSGSFFSFCWWNREAPNLYSCKTIRITTFYFQVMKYFCLLRHIYAVRTFGKLLFKLIPDSLVGLQNLLVVSVLRTNWFCEIASDSIWRLKVSSDTITLSGLVGDLSYWLTGQRVQAVLFLYLFNIFFSFDKSTLWREGMWETHEWNKYSM